MSLAYKLWKIGSVLTEEDIRSSIKDESEKDLDFLYFNIDFTVKGGVVESIQINENAISKDKMFFTKKIGGSGTGIYYLYPNLNLQKSSLIEKLSLLANTLSSSVVSYSNPKNSNLCNLIIETIKHSDNHIKRVKLEAEIKQYERKLEKSKSELEELLSSQNKEHIKRIESEIKKDEDRLIKLKLEYQKFLSDTDKDEWVEDLLKVSEVMVTKDVNNYWFWFSVNGKTFFELMPEIWENWYKCPVTKNDNTKEGYDIFTNELTEIGYRPEVKVFSYDNYHDSLKFRINENLPFSLESARNIKFAWLYILESLVFYYKGLEYVIVPNLLLDDQSVYRTILKKLKEAKVNSSNKVTILKSLAKQEDKLDKKIKKEKTGVLLLKHSKLEEELINVESINVESETKETDLGIVSEFNEQVDYFGDLKNSITIDYLFIEVNRTNLSFSIKGSIEDVVPSHISNVVRLMKEHKIDDLIKLGKRREGFTPIQDFFHRTELYLVLNKSAKNNKNKILTERLYLANLLLTDEQIRLDNLLKRFEINREFNYEMKKRVLNDGVKEWIAYTDFFSRDENRIRKFFDGLNKIKE